jgi:pimeloyl-ACP methyl ester carboxylesterase
VLNYKPGGPSYTGVTVPQETEIICGPFMLRGRAVFVTVIRGMRERDLPADWVPPDVGSVAHRDMMIYDTVDQRRGLDYLQTCDDIARDKVVCMGLSMGGYDLVTMAVEDRFQGVILLSAGFGPGAKRTIAAANPINFAPYIKGPKLMMHGRYDEGIPFKTSGEPLFHLLSEPKELIVLESGHLPPMDLWVPPALEFLDSTLGPVETTDGASEFAQRRQ